MANAERFVTPALEEYEAKVLGAEERLRALEAQLFAELVRDAARAPARAGAHGRRRWRASTSSPRWPLVAERRRYARPSVGRDRRIAISDGRHPVVEAVAGRERLRPQRLHASIPTSAQILIITGPNMAGKSTYLRQVALITLLAQMGSFVPAAAAEIGVVDRIFTRVGASDNLAGGESTFMVEMKETANILTQLTPRSLVMLDEIGRGTSTFDGISIAWAVAEHLHEAAGAPAGRCSPPTTTSSPIWRAASRGCATPRWRCASGRATWCSCAASSPGPASQSYGIQVAQLAGVPAPVIERAGQILHNLERNELTDSGQPRLALDDQPAANGQLGLFAAADDRLRDELAAIDVDRLTPLEALNRLHELVTRARRS